MGDGRAVWIEAAVIRRNLRKEFLKVLRRVTGMGKHILLIQYPPGPL